MKRLPVPFIGQGQDLPTGCESVSAAMVLQYLGFSVTAEEFAREWLPRGRFYRDENGVRHGPDPRHPDGLRGRLERPADETPGRYGRGHGQRPAAGQGRSQLPDRR